MAAAPSPAPATASAQALLTQLSGRPGSTAAELAEAARIGRSTATTLLASLAAAGRVLRQPGGRQHGRRAPDRWTLLPASQAPQPPASSTATTGPAAVAAQPAHQPPGAGRLRPGGLRQLVLACLADRPGQALSPTAIGAQLGRSAGAVANALKVLADQGLAVQTQSAPRRYRLAATSEPPTTTGS